MHICMVYRYVLRSDCRNVNVLHGIGKPSQVLLGGTAITHTPAPHHPNHTDQPRRHPNATKRLKLGRTASGK